MRLSTVVPASARGIACWKMTESSPRTCSVAEALKRLGRPVVFYPSLAKLVGIEEAIFLAQLVYWTPRSKSEAGWIFKSADDLENETGLTYRQQRRVRQSLGTGKGGRGLIQERYAREEHRFYLRVIPEALDRLSPEDGAPDVSSDAHVTDCQLPPDETSQGTLPNVSSIKETEITPDSTHRRSAPICASSKLIEVLQSASDAAHPSSDPSTREGLLETLKTVAQKTDLSVLPAQRTSRQHDFEEAIFRKDVAKACFDFDRRGDPQDQVLRGAIEEAARSLLSKRSMELRNIQEVSLSKTAWERVQSLVAGTAQIAKFEDRQKFVVKIAVRAVAATAVALLAETGQSVAMQVHAPIPSPVGSMQEVLR